MIRKNTFLLILILFCLSHFIFWLAVCYPGVLYGDNATMLVESFPGGGIGDQHSVMYIWLLRICHNLFGIGVAYPLIWGLAFWHLGVFFFTLGLHNLYKSYWVLLFAFAFTDIPFINFVLPHLQLKDMNMSAVFFAACGLLFWIMSGVSEGKRKWGLAVSLIFFFLAITFRHNAIFGFLPFAFLFAALLLPYRGKSLHWHRAKVFLISAFLIGALFFGKSRFDKAAGDYENYFIHGCLFSFDLAGISVNVDEMQIPEERLMPGITLVDLKKVFNPAGWDPLWGGWGSSPRILKGVGKKEEMEVLRDQWMHSVRDHFGAYLTHRWNHFERFLHGHNVYLCICEWTPAASWESINTLVSPEMRKFSIDKLTPDDFRIRGAGFLGGMEKFNKGLDRTAPGRMFIDFPFYLLLPLNLALIVSVIFSICVWKKPTFFGDTQRKMITFSMIMLLSAWMYLMAYFFVSVSTDWRYVHWTTLSFWIGSIFLAVSLPYQSIYSKLIGIFQKG